MKKYIQETICPMLTLASCKALKHGNSILGLNGFKEKE